MDSLRSDISYLGNRLALDHPNTLYFGEGKLKLMMQLKIRTLRMWSRPRREKATLPEMKLPIWRRMRSYEP